ncbi:MAG TPA: hypothetical protein VFP59_18765 [Candidatus Angelobacter sp.]|nr:hypothetical protein [Candidatus Angelobacter sp.]
MIRRFLPVIAFVLLAGVSLRFQAAVFDFRPPTPREQKVLRNYLRVINKVLAQFKDGTWEENVDHSLANAEVDPSSEFPLHMNGFVQRTYLVRHNSDRYKQMVLPLVQEMVLSSDLNHKRELNRQVEDLTVVQVQVRLNQPRITVNPKPENNHDLHIPGTALAYKINNDEFSTGSGYVLLFGNPQALSWNSYHNWFDYKFMQGGNAPSLENVEFLISGAEDRIQQLLHTVDWNEVNNALTSGEGGAAASGLQPELQR